MKKWFRKIHRWLGLLIAVQIMAWMLSGLYFAWYPIETIRGEHLVTEVGPLEPVHLDGLVSPREAWRVVAASGEDLELDQVSIVRGMGRTWYRIAGTSADQPFARLVDARTAEIMPFMDGEQAGALAQSRVAVPGTITGTELVSEHRAGSEYRGRALPLWRVRFSEPESLNLYIDGWTGEIVARRTTRWRIFDFLWMLHIMDFEERDDFNTGLLQLAAALGFVLAVTGLVYWALSTRVFRRRRKPGVTQS